MGKKHIPEKQELNFLLKKQASVIQYFGVGTDEKKIGYRLFIRNVFMCNAVCLYIFLHCTFIYVLIENVIYHIDVKRFDLLQCSVPVMQTHSPVFYFISTIIKSDVTQGV